MDAENPVVGRPSVNYKLSIDFAKKLCMVSKSSKGEQARNYFIEVEKRFKAVSAPTCLEDMIIAQATVLKVFIIMNELIKIDASGKITEKELYEFLSPDDRFHYSRWAKTNIENNEFYSEGMDWAGFATVRTVMKPRITA